MSLSVPEAVPPYKVNRVYAGTIIAVHLLGLLAFVPYFFSWIGLFSMIVGVHLFGQGITIGYHRLLTHRSFKTPQWVEYTLTTLGLCCLQDSPVQWVTTHRIHHVHSDHQPDPHTPLVNFFWSHIGWLIVKNRETHSLKSMEKFAKDLLRDPFYMYIEKKPMTRAYIALLQLPVFFLIGYIVGWIGWGQASALQLGLSMIVWAVYVRVIAVWHISWSVNSLTHMFGYQNYKTDEHSRNNWLIAFFTVGEGWHNNHHEDPSTANLHHKWWEFDLSYYEIKFLEKLGLASEIIEPRYLRHAETKKS